MRSVALLLVAACGRRAPVPADASIPDGGDATASNDGGSDASKPDGGIDVPDAAPLPLAPAARGCAMAHCDPAMSDRVRMPLPPGAVEERWHDGDAAGANIGLGCASNGTVAVCSLGGVPGGGPYLKAYDADGRILWTSEELLGFTTFTSAPVVLESGGAIAADDSVLVRFEPDGRVAWRTATPGGRPISPTITEDGTVVLATQAGPISAYDGESGALLATLELTDVLDGLSGRFDTRNTPAMRGNRLYVSMEFRLDDGTADPNHHARLVAIDVDVGAPEADRLAVAWSFELGARSGASPLRIGDVIYFDGDRLAPDAAVDPHFFAVRDDGDHPSLVWTHAIGAPAAASAAQDPRGGLWVFARGVPELVRLSEDDGQVVQTLDTDALVDALGEHSPTSAISVAEGPDGRGALVFSASTAAALSTFVVAVDVEASALLWRHRADGLPAGQFPIVATPGGESVVVYATAGTGVFGVGPR